MVARARLVDTEQALLFAIANDTYAMVPYRVALVFSLVGGAPRFVYQSGLSTVDRRSAFGSWCESVVQALLPQIEAGGPVSAQQVPEPLRVAWQEYWPETVYLHRLMGHKDQTLGAVLYVCEQPWSSQVEPLMGVLHQAYGLCLQAVRSKPGAWWRAGSQPDGRPRHMTRWVVGTLAALVLALCIPVRQFVVAPAEIISLDTVAVTSPVEGIVAELVAKPNQAVKKGDVLVRLDDTAIRNRLASARQALEVARAEYLAGAHRALVASDKAAETGVLRGRISERSAELAFLQDQLGMLSIRATREGIAVYGQESDWIGRPVGAGQRLMELADPSKLGVQIWVPVADAINLEGGSPLTLLLHADPLHPISARIEQASYQATKSPDGVAAYRVRARMDDGSRLPRLGLRGSAKMDGQWVPLAYFLLRRPLAVMRQWTGI